MNPGILTPPTQYATMPQGLLGRPTPLPLPDQYWHPEALDWQGRVRRNGGSVSIATLAAVSEFCNTIDAAGLRSRFLRLNLFAGDSISAALVPLYRAVSLTASVVGNATDTNFNFVSGDFQETGVGGGLKGNKTSKYLRTGVSVNTPPYTFASTQIVDGMHLSASATNCETTGTATLIGGNGQFGGTYHQLNSSGRYYTGGSHFFGSPPVVTAPTSPETESHFIGVRSATLGTLTVYQGGRATATASGVSAFAAGGNQSFGVLANVNNSTTTANQYSAARIRMYSIGYGLTAAQALAFSNAVIAFNTALRRA